MLVVVVRLAGAAGMAGVVARATAGTTARTALVVARIVVIGDAPGPAPGPAPRATRGVRVVGIVAISHETPPRLGIDERKTHASAVGMLHKPASLDITWNMPRSI